MKRESQTVSKSKPEVSPAEQLNDNLDDCDSMIIDERKHDFISHPKREASIPDEVSDIDENICNSKSNMVVSQSNYNNLPLQDGEIKDGLLFKDMLWQNRSINQMIGSVKQESD
jgi:hypothetical protein